MYEILNKAIIFAVNAHAGGKRKGSDLPYIVHPLETLAIASSMTEEESILAAAVLHDVVEDTAVSLEDIEENFGELIASYVADESENKRLDKSAEDTWKIRKQETIDHLRTARLGTKMLTLSDKLSNMRSMDRDYDELGEALWQRFHQKEKSEHAWYYKSICDIVSASELADTKAFKEYENLVNKVFNI